MRLSHTIWFQLAATFVQFVVVPMPVIPPEWEKTLHGLIAFIQAAQAIFAHTRTPDGDPIQ